MEAFVVGFISGSIITILVTFINAYTQSGRRYFVRAKDAHEIEDLYLPPSGKRSKVKSNGKFIIIDPVEEQLKKEAKADELAPLEGSVKSRRQSNS